MSDISRNNQKKIVQVTEKQPIPMNELKDNNIQIHFGNAKVIELKLLESINRHLAEIVVMMKDAKK